MNASVKRCILRGGAEWAPDASASQTVYPRKQGQTPHTGASADKAATVRVASALLGECTKTQSGGVSNSVGSLVAKPGWVFIPALRRHPGGDGFLQAGMVFLQAGTVFSRQASLNRWPGKAGLGVPAAPLALAHLPSLPPPRATCFSPAAWQVPKVAGGHLYSTPAPLCHKQGERSCWISSRTFCPRPCFYSQDRLQKSTLFPP